VILEVYVAGSWVRTDIPPEMWGVVTSVCTKPVRLVDASGLAVREFHPVTP
jgi:hypothetical protein